MAANKFCPTHHGSQSLTDAEAKDQPVATYSHACTTGFPIAGQYFLYQHLSQKLKNKINQINTLLFLFFSLVPGVKVFLQRATQGKNALGFKSYCLCYNCSALILVQHGHSHRHYEDEWANCVPIKFITMIGRRLNLGHGLLTPVLCYLSGYFLLPYSFWAIFSLKQSGFQIPSYLGLLFC